MSITIRRELAESIIDKAEGLSTQAFALGESIRESHLAVRSVGDQVAWAIRATWTAQQHRAVSDSDLHAAVKTASDARLLELGCGQPKIDEYRSAQRRLARRQSDQADIASRGHTWGLLAQQVRDLLKRHYPDAPAAAHVPVDRSRSLAEVGAEIERLEAGVMSISFRTDGSAPAEGLSHAEVTARVSDHLDRLLDHAGDALATSLQKLQGGQDVDLLVEDQLEAPGGDALGGWTAQALGQSSRAAVASVVLLLGKSHVMKALQPHIAQLPVGLPAAERASRLAAFTRDLKALYENEAGLMLDDDGDLLPDADPRRGMKADALVLVSA